MEQFYFFLLFIIALSSSLEYHGNIRYWTTVDSDGKTFVALHILEDSVNIIFPAEKTFDEIVSDIKLYSPTGNGKCLDIINTLEFTLMFRDQNHIRGVIKKEVHDDNEQIKMYMYEKCSRTETPNHYAAEMIEDIQQNLENDGRTCFITGNPFLPYKDATKKIMELKSTSNGFGCQVFMILPKYMHVEDFKLPKFDTVKPLNASYAGHDEKFWWKSANDSMLPSVASFDSLKNVKINILNSTKDNPYFFRIGTGQPIPTFKFNFGVNCKHAKFEIFLNLKSECQVLIQMAENGFFVSTKSSANNFFKGSLSTMVFGGKNVFVKVDSPLTMKPFEVCGTFSNTQDVPSDQFVLQVSPLENVDGCEKAEIVLSNSDVVNDIEVLIDRLKIIKNTNGTINKNSTFPVTTTESTESAGFPWYGYLIIGLVAVGVLAAIIIIVFCLRRRRRQKPKKTPLQPIESVEDEEVGRRTVATKTAVSPEKLSKEQKPKISDGEKNEKKKEATKEITKELPKEGDKPLKPNEPDKLPSTLPAKPPIQTPKPVQSTPIRKSKPAPLPVIPPRPLRNLKHRSLYGKDKRTKLDEAFDYHADENPEFKPTKIPAKFVRPDFRVFKNFWDCLGEILQTNMFCQIFADDFCDKNTNVYFMVRDLVAKEYYAPLRTLSNRILEEFEPQEKKVEPYFEKDGNKRIKRDWYYCLRVFILSYDPLTIEIHCRGPWPHFIFNIFNCTKCIELYKELQANEWKNSPVACNEDWQSFICRVKKTPVNFHQFLCYYGDNGASEPENPNDVNNVLIIRGDWERDNLRQCSRGCILSDDKSHFNDLELETPLQSSPSLSN